MHLYEVLHDEQVHQLKAIPGSPHGRDPLFAKKSISALMEEAKETGEHSLKRTLGPFQLTALGVGAVIGAGIFVLSGLGAHYAGPGLMLSFVLSGLGCAFAALCYAEFAAMIPLAGSAYTYAYATLGEIFAWIIGWDLTLEYAMGASTVSSGWSNHFIELLNIFHIKMPLWLAYDHWTGVAHGGKSGGAPDGPGLPTRIWCRARRHFSIEVMIDHGGAFAGADAARARLDACAQGFSGRRLGLICRLS